LEVAPTALLRAASKVFRYVADDGVEEELHHLGLIYEVSIHDHGGEDFPAVKSGADGEDSGGAAWVRVDRLAAEELTQFAVLALSSGAEVGRVRPR